MLSIRSAASTRTSEPRPIVTPLALISPSASFGPSVIGSIPARRSASSPGSVSPSYSAQPRPISTLPMSAISDRSPCPTEPTIRTIGCTPALSSATSSSISSRRTPTPGLQHPVDARDHHRPHDVGRQRTPVGGDLVGDGGERERADLVERDVVARQRAEPGVEPVHRLAAGQHAVDHVAGGADPDQRLRVELDARAAARHGQHMVHGQAIAAERRCSRWLRR